MSAATQTEKAEAIARLREIVRPGDTLYTILRHVSQSGMMRHVDVYKLSVEHQNAPCEPVYLSGYAAKAIGAPRTSKGEIKVGGCGMDVGFEVVYNLSYALFREGFECIGESCPSNDHSNGDRDYSPHHHTDPGYGLKQRWL